MLNRRRFLAASTATITVLPWMARAATSGDVFSGSAGDIVVHPIDHASIVLETPMGVIYVDPVGDPAMYADYPRPNLILVTHEHGDHFNADTLTALATTSAMLVTNPAVHDKLPDALKAGAKTLANGESLDRNGVKIDAIPAYNTTEERKNFHPQGRDNGYVLTIGDFRTYISGDTEDIPEMRALKDIDLAFLCMNLPFTMDLDQAASAVAEFKPRVVYPYHYRGRDGGTQDPAAFAAKVGSAVEVKLHDWYNGKLG